MVETINMHRHTNFASIGLTVFEISRFSLFKMDAVCHLVIRHVGKSNMYGPNKIYHNRSHLLIYCI